MSEKPEIRTENVGKRRKLFIATTKENVKEKYVIYYDLYIGAGGFGKVYQGYSFQEKTNVAVKIAKFNQIGMKGKKRIQQEINLLKKMSHPNINSLLVQK